jgi:urease accessory protein UreF
MLAAVHANSSVTLLLSEPMTESVQNLRAALDAVAAAAAAVHAPATKEFVDRTLVPALQGAAEELTAAFSQQKQRSVSRQWMNTLDIASSSSSDDEEEDEKEATKESKSKLTYTSPFGLSEATWKKEAQRVLDNYLLVHKVLHVYILHAGVRLT